MYLLTPFRMAILCMVLSTIVITDCFQSPIHLGRLRECLTWDDIGGFVAVLGTTVGPVLAMAISLHRVQLYPRIHKPILICSWGVLILHTLFIVIVTVEVIVIMNRFERPPMMATPMFGALFVPLTIPISLLALFIAFLTPQKPPPSPPASTS